jgi:hypothetical protein
MLRTNRWKPKLYDFLTVFSKLKLFREFKETDVLSLTVRHVQLNTAQAEERKIYELKLRILLESLNHLCASFRKRIALENKCEGIRWHARIRQGKRLHYPGPDAFSAYIF